MRPDTSLGNVLTIRDLSKVLSCSKTHISNLLNGKVAGLPPLTHVSIGRRKIVRREWLERWLEVNKVG